MAEVGPAEPRTLTCLSPSPEISAMMTVSEDLVMGTPVNRTEALLSLRLHSQREGKGQSHIRHSLPVTVLHSHMCDLLQETGRSSWMERLWLRGTQGGKAPSICTVFPGIKTPDRCVDSHEPAQNQGECEQQ